MDCMKAVALRLLALHPKDRQWILKRLPKEAVVHITEKIDEIELCLGSAANEIRDEICELSQSMIRESIALAGETYRLSAGLSKLSSDEFSRHIKDVMPTRLLDYLFVKESWLWLKPKKFTDKKLLSLKPKVHKELIHQLAEYYASDCWKQDQRERMHG